MAPSDRIALDLGSSLLLTDLYQLNMLQAYRDAGMVPAAPGKTLVDFGLRRAHGAEDDAAAGAALIRPVMRRGERVASPSLEHARRRARQHERAWAWVVGATTTGPPASCTG